jgi:hypothetical protein
LPRLRHIDADLRDTGVDLGHDVPEQHGPARIGIEDAALLRVA